MKGRVVALGAVALIAIGAIGDHVLSSQGAGPLQAIANAKTNTTTTTTNNSTKPIRQTAAIVSASPTTMDQATESAYAKAGPSVVYVENVGIGTGSGIVYDSNGDIVTNNHVVNGQKSLRVTLSDGRTFKATLVGTDPADDLAVMHINASNLHPAKFAKAGSFHVAQTVLAVGSPLGLKSSVTSGLISGLNRVQQEPSGAYLPNAIQTSAPINPGNSGGALITLSGVVVGMPTMVQTSTSNGEATQNIGFAVPSTRITLIASQIISTGKVQHTGRAYMGIVPTDAGNQSVDPFSQGQITPTVQGAALQQVSPTGPAGKAGLQQGDVITEVDGTSITSAQDLLTVLAQHKPGDTVTVKVNRNGSTQTVTVHLGELPG